MLKIARPYSRFASFYDATIGRPAFRHTRIIFERLVRHHRLKFRSAADLGCGTGLFACYLNRRWGVPVFAVDRSPEMLRVAVGSCPGGGVIFLRQDMRRMRLPVKVDLVTCHF